MSETEDYKPPLHDISAPPPRASSSLDNPNDLQVPEAKAIFPVGQILESRFRLVRLLGEGGMGQVYEAEDLVLKENVALKTLLPHIAANEHFRGRFRREVLLARKVTHPNVCRIFEVFGATVTPSSGPGANSTSMPFMTMELLEGQTLTKFLEEDFEGVNGIRIEKRKRRLTPEEALPLVTQMIAALEAAHQAGVVHRDFKSSNIFLAVRPGTTERRVVVTDFGLARLSQAEGLGSVTFTEEKEFIGTPLYMSPEQIEGGEITAVTDIYALGVVLYEMTTGTWPFIGKSPRETANLRLKTNAAPPRSQVPSLDSKWNTVILRCLERDPADRFQSAREVLDALAGETAALRRHTRVQRDRLRKTLIVGATAAFLLTGAFSAYLWWPRRLLTAGVTAAAKVNSAAVVRFQNLSQRPDKDWIGASLSEVLTRDLAASDRLRVTSSEDVERMRQELVIPATGELDPTKLDEIRANLGADRLILGDYELSGPPNDQQVRVTLRILDASQSKPTETIADVGHESDLFDLSDHLARDLRSRLDVGPISDEARAGLRAALPSNSAARAYFNGLEKLRQFDPLAATGFLKDAIRDSPDSPLPHFALSQAWDVLGYDQQALAEAKRAQEASQSLSKPEQREIDCRVLELERQNWDDAVGACRGLWVLRKGIEDGLRLADVQFAGERWKDALATVAAVRSEVQPMERNDPRIDITEAKVREALTQYPEMEQAAQAARDKARKQGARLFEAQALLWSCVAQQNRDRFVEARESCTTANDIFQTVGDRIGEARARTNLANILTKVNDLDGATHQYEKALQLAASVGSARDRCDALMNYAGALYDRSKTTEAVRKYDESLKVGEQSGNRGCEAKALEGLGMIARGKRNFDSAFREFGQSAKIFSELNMDADFAQLQSNIGQLLWKQGDVSSARAHFEDAAKRRRDLGLRHGLTITLLDLGDVRLAQDELEAALAAYKEANSIQTELQEADNAAITEISIAMALVETGSFEDAEKSARKLAAWCSTKHDPEDEVFARDVLVRALLAQHRYTEAVKEANELQRLILPSMDGDVRFSAGITVAQALAIQKSSSQPLADLRVLASEARQQGFLMQELSAHLALAEAEKLQGMRSSTVELIALTSRAKSKGFLLIARKLSSLIANQ